MWRSASRRKPGSKSKIRRRLLQLARRTGSVWLQEQPAEQRVNRVATGTPLPPYPSWWLPFSGLPYVTMRQPIFFSSIRRSVGTLRYQSCPDQQKKSPNVGFKRSWTARWLSLSTKHKSRQLVCLPPSYALSAWRAKANLAGSEKQNQAYRDSLQRQTKRRPWETAGGFAFLGPFSSLVDGCVVEE